jgi:hypothetical protein
VDPWPRDHRKRIIDTKPPEITGNECNTCNKPPPVVGSNQRLQSTSNVLKEFGTLRSQVQILSPRIKPISVPFDDQVEGISVCRNKTYVVETDVQTQRIEDRPPFRWFCANIRICKTLREFKHFDGLVERTPGSARIAGD